MLQFVYEAERGSVANYKKRAGQEEKAGEVGLQTRLEDIISDETTHRDEVKKILDGWG